MGHPGAVPELLEQPEPPEKGGATPPAGRPVTRLTRELLIRGGVLICAAIVLLVAAALLLRHGIVRDRYPAYVTGTDHTDIARWSGPWVMTAGAAFLVGCVCLTVGTILTTRAVRIGRRRLRAGSGAAVPPLH